MVSRKRREDRTRTTLLESDSEDDVSSYGSATEAEDLEEDIDMEDLDTTELENVHSDGKLFSVSNFNIPIFILQKTAWKRKTLTRSARNTFVKRFGNSRSYRIVQSSKSKPIATSK